MEHDVLENRSGNSKQNNPTEQILAANYLSSENPSAYAEFNENS